MVASYPGTVRPFTTKADITGVIYAEHPNSLQDEVVAIEGIVGVNPHVSTSPSSAGTFNYVSHPFDTLAARLANIETGVVSDAHNQYVHNSGGDQILPGTISTVGLMIKCTSGQTADLLEFQDSSGTTKAAFSADGSLTVNNLTVNGTQTNVAGSALALDLGSTTGTAAGTGTNYGDKIQFFQNTFGFGMASSPGSGRLVAFLPANAGFAVRQASSTGYASSGTDAVVLGSNGTVTATGLGSLGGGLDLSGSGGTLAGSGSGVGDKASFSTNTGLGVTNATHLSMYLNGSGSVFQVVPANTGAGAKSASVTPGAQFTGSGIGNFKSDVRVNNVPVARGVLDLATNKTNRGHVAGETMMSEFRLNFNAVAGQYYRVTFSPNYGTDNTSQLVIFRLKTGSAIGSTNIATAIVTSAVGDPFGFNSVTLSWLFNDLSGAVTLEPSIAPYLSSFFVYNAGAPDAPGMIWVEHCGGPAQTAL